MSLIVVADIVAKEDKVDFVKSETEKLIPITREEKGCMEHNLHQDNNRPNHFIMYENWESKEDLKAHANNTHMKKYAEAVKDCVLSSAIHEMTKLS